MSAAAPARFASADQRRRSLLGKVHIAKKELKLSEDAYRDVLFGITGKDSAGKCSEGELGKVLDRMRALGWTPANPKGRTTSRPADHPSAKKARALWISLYHLGVIENPAEQALEAFAARQLKCERLQWTNQGQTFRLIEALKGMAERAGWQQDTAGMPLNAVPKALRRRLVERIVEAMKEIELIPAHWRVSEAAFRLAGIEMRGMLITSADELDRIAQALGDKLRIARAALGNQGDER